MARRILGVLLLAGLCQAVSADQGADFRTAYEAYRQHVAAGRTAEAKASAEKAYRLGSRLYGRNSANAAKLAINFARLLNDGAEYKKAARILRNKIDAMEEAYGAGSSELIPVLVEMARARFDPKSPDAALTHFRRASALLAADADVRYRGLKNYDIATELFRRGGTPWSRPFVEAAHAVFSEHLQPNDIRRGLMAYHLGLWTVGDERPDVALGHFEHALTAFETEGEMGDLERTVRMRLVDILERTGRSDEATAHCLALGAAEIWQMPPWPLYMTYPRYAAVAFEGLSEGQVTLGFTIDVEGFVRDPRVLESTRPSLDAGALAAVGGFRYAPRFVDGASVRTDDVTFTYSFDFVSSSRESDEGPSPWPGFDLSMPPRKSFFRSRQWPPWGWPAGDR